MDRNTTVAFVLIGLILVVWLYINSPEPQPQTPKSASDTTLVQDDVPSAAVDTQSAKIKEEVPPAIDSLLISDSDKEERIITVENDDVVLELTTKGARIKKYFLKEYKMWYAINDNGEGDFYKNHVQLVNYSKEGGDLNIVFVTKTGQLLNTSKLDFTTDADDFKYTVPAGDSLELAFEYKMPEDRIIRKIFKFYGSNFVSKLDIELLNFNDFISSYRYDVIWANGINFVEKNSVDESTYSNASAYTGDEQVVVDASSAGEKVSKDLNGRIDWISLRNKYFGIIISPDNPDTDGGAYFEGHKTQAPNLDEREFYSASLKIPFQDSKFQKNSFELYIGPLIYDNLKSFGRGYESAFDFGSFFGMKFITRPISEYILLPLFTFLHKFIPNYGFVIILFSIIIKFALYPLTKQSYKSMKRMQLLQPKIAELKEKHKDDPQKVQKETMKLYQTYGINPAGGCLPTLLQMPILFALFTFFNVTVELRQEPFIFWITNLSAPDVIFKLPFTVPLFGITHITGLAPLLGITMFLQQKMTMKDPSQKMLVYLMPIMFTLMFMNFASGLNLYYFLFNLFSIAQQNLINKNKSDMELKPVDKKGKKKGGGFMARMMEAAEKQAKAQKESQKKGRR
ncbi:MAG: membrane protein insertase YidC [Melioribacteraceae bacterium]|nr:membrane protein insertase YidC [Melioribacteraceae bacterium]